METRARFILFFVTANHSGSYRNLEFCHLLVVGGNKKMGRRKLHEKVCSGQCGHHYVIDI